MPGEEEVHDSPVAWVAEHTRQYIETNGEEGHIWRGVPTLALTTTGRRSGKPRRTMLIYGRDGDRYLVVASSGEAAHRPAWYHHLIEIPAVAVQVGADAFAPRARAASAGEKPALWETMVAIFPPYAKYQSEANRDIPVVILERS